MRALNIRFKFIAIAVLLLVVASVALVSRVRALPVPPARAGGGEISLGVTQTGTIQFGSSDVWFLELERGQFVRIQMESQSGTPGVAALRPEVALVRDDVTGSTTLGVARAGVGVRVAQLRVNCLPRGGRHNIIARGAFNSGAGPYSITIDAINKTDEFDSGETVPCAVTDTETDRTKDACGRVFVDVHPKVGSPVRVQKGQTKFVLIPDDGEIRWDCLQSGDFDDERAKCPNGSNLVRITRAPTGRRIFWTCYTRQFVQ